MIALLVRHAATASDIDFVKVSLNLIGNKKRLRMVIFYLQNMWSHSKIQIVITNPKHCIESVMVALYSS